MYHTERMKRDILFKLEKGWLSIDLSDGSKYSHLVIDPLSQEVLIRDSPLSQIFQWCYKVGLILLITIGLTWTLNVYLFIYFASHYTKIATCRLSLGWHKNHIAT